MASSSLIRVALLVTVLLAIICCLPLCVAAAPKAWAEIKEAAAAVPRNTDDQCLVPPSDPPPVLTWLPDNTTVFGEQGRGNSSYYVYVLQSASPPSVLNITVTAIDGDPDLYVSTVWPWPSQSCFNWSSSMSGSDVVIISPAPNTNYFIAVYAWADTSFNVFAHAVTASNSTRNKLQPLLQ